MLMRCLRCCWLPFDVVMMWCWCDMNYLYTAESYLRCKCRSKSISYRMFMKFLRCKMLSPCILIQSWGLDALELLLNHDDGAFAQTRRWSFCSTMTMELLLKHDDGAFAQPWRWSFCSTTTMRAYALKWYHMHLHFMMIQDGLRR
jgi:hypothetical protein